MDSATLFSSPLFLFLLVVGSAWVGYAIGKSNETKRKQLALEEARKASEQVLGQLRDEGQEKLNVLAKASASEMDQLKQAHSQQIDQLNQAHQTLVDSIKTSHADETHRLSTEHSSLVDRLNEANNATIRDMEQRRQDEMQMFKGEHQRALDGLRSDHEQALRQLQERSGKDLERLNSEAAGLRAERDDLRHEVTTLQGTVMALREEIKESKLTNMFSVSKSGDKLIRVVRSVQELASELDETSRTVTGGEYSFFEQIKDQRDRDTVLSLAAGGNAERPAVADVDAAAEDKPTAGDTAGDDPSTNG
ncbi:MAG: hypothetical protein LJE59_00645 [Chromatiaceae bacterium]|nr:hypothetical protein [Chromatiaceae bacterium]